MDKIEKIPVSLCGGRWGIGSYKYIDHDGTECLGYGLASPENPHDFFPDPECCTPDEISAWEKAKQEWSKANGQD